LEPWAQAHEIAFADFVKYKIRVPVCGAIILDELLENVLLVKGWNSQTWTFPRGKINKGEPELTCALREVMEEVGFDLTPHLTYHNASRRAHESAKGKRKVKGKGPAHALREPDHFEMTIKEQRLRLYIASGVPNQTQFTTHTRKEISDIAWHRISELPGFTKGPPIPHDPSKGKRNKYYMLMPFMGPLKKWIKRSRQKLKSGNGEIGSQNIGDSDEDVMELQSESDPENSNRLNRQSVGIQSRENATRALKSLLGMDPTKASSYEGSSPDRTQEREENSSFIFNDAPLPFVSLPEHVPPPPAIPRHARSLLDVIHAKEGSGFQNPQEVLTYPSCNSIQSGTLNGSQLGTTSWGILSNRPATPTSSLASFKLDVSSTIICKE
jgi:8-oxo-dGTP pyrophosphatase MutT (NUDIX family)